MRRNIFQLNETIETVTRKMFRIGIIGAGWIAEKMAFALSRTEDMQVYAIGSRTIEKAEEFARRWNIPKAYGSYEELVSDGNVDLVYIATPHSHHYPHAKLALEHGRPVLVEKAFTANAKEAEELIDLAHRKNIFLTEAIWTRYMPLSHKIGEIMASGIIGEPRIMTATLCYMAEHKERIISPDLCGGALLDLGVYTLNFATTVLGDDVKKIDATVVKHDTGVDKNLFVNLTYENGSVAGLFNTIQTITDRKGVIYGTKGYIFVDNINNYEAFRIYNQQHELLETIERPQQITGFEYQVRACKRALEEGKLECDEMPHEHTIKIMEIIEEIRRVW